jgi:hypothetical protein
MSSSTFNTPPCEASEKSRPAELSDKRPHSPQAADAAPAAISDGRRGPTGCCNDCLPQPHVHAADRAPRPEETGLAAGLKHFVRLARRGRSRGCSSGERNASKLAEAILSYASGLDESAIDGAVNFMRGASLAPWVARDLIR